MVLTVGCVRAGTSSDRRLLQNTAGDLYEEVVKALLDGDIPAAGDLMKTGIQKGQAAEIASAISAAAAAVRHLMP